MKKVFEKMNCDINDQLLMRGVWAPMLNSQPISIAGARRRPYDIGPSLSQETSSRWTFRRPFSKI